MGGGIAVPERMVGDDGKAFPEEVGEIGVHGERHAPRSIQVKPRDKSLSSLQYCRFMPSADFSRRAFLYTVCLASLASARDEETQRWRVAVIGNTPRGGYGHGLDTMWLDLPETEIIAVADPDAAGLGKAVDRLGKPKAFADYRRMLAEAKPDLVAIGTRWVGEHRDMALAAIEAGVRGIYMEKPFCRDLKEAREIVEAAKQKGAKIALAHRNRYHPALPMVKKLVDGGEIGRLLEIRGRGKEDHRGGVQDLWVLGSHVLNLAVLFSGKPVACSASLFKDGKVATPADVQDGKEDIGPIAGNELHARFETESGVPVFFDSIADAGVKEANFGLQLVGTKGVIDLRVDDPEFAHLRRGNPFMPVGEASPWLQITSAGVDKPEPIANVGKQVGGHLLPARDLIAAIGEKREPLCSAEDGALTIAMIFAVLESHRRGGGRVAMPLRNEGNPLSGE